MLLTSGRKHIFSARPWGIVGWGAESPCKEQEGDTEEINGTFYILRWDRLKWSEVADLTRQCSEYFQWSLKVTMEKKDTQKNSCVCWPAGQPSASLQQEVGISMLKTALFVGDVQPLTEWTEALWQCNKKKNKEADSLFHFLCFCLSPAFIMASNLPVERGPCATVPHKYTRLKNKIGRKI